MAQMSMDLPTVTLHVRMPRLYSFRMWCVAVLFRLAGLIGPVGVEIETVVDTGRKGEGG